MSTARVKHRGQTAVSLAAKPWLSPSHPAWVLAQQFGLRGLAAAKFLIAARVLGPDQLGTLTVALLALAVAEALTDTGLQQSVVQMKRPPNRLRAGAIWTVSLTRAVAISLLLSAIAIPASRFFRAPSAAPLILLCCLVPLFRGAVNPGVYLRQRERANKDIALYELTAASVDFVVAAVALWAGVGPVALILGTIAADCVKLSLSWFVLRLSLLPTFRWRFIARNLSYGKWVWGSSVLGLCLNQLDKAVVARMMGPADVGLYQLASKVAQLVIADAAIAAGNYLFPSFAQKNRTSAAAARMYLVHVCKRYVPAFAVAAISLCFFSPWLVGFAFGESWAAAVPILRILSAAMFLGSVIAILVAFVRAVGLPQAVVQASGLQLIVLVSLAPWLTSTFGAVGMACAISLALFVSVLVFLRVAFQWRQ